MTDFDRPGFVRWLCGALGLFLLLVITAPAQAQEAPSESEAAAPTEAQLDLNDRAVENIVEGNHARAVAQLEEAVLRGEFNILYLNLGRAYQKLGNCEKARAALAKAKTAPAVAEPAPHLVRKKADQYLAELDKTCASTAQPPGEGDEQGGAEDKSTDGDGSDSGSESDADANAFAEPPAVPYDVRRENPNLLYVEFAGHGGASTINYERFFLIDYDLWGAVFDLGAGIGFGHTQGELEALLGEGTGRLETVPLYASATFWGGTHSMLVQLGLVFAKFESKDVSLEGTSGLLQLGYQLHLDGGFLLRASLSTVNFGKRKVLPGLSLGWSF